MSVLVGREAPEITTAAVMSDGSIDESFSLAAEIEDSYAVLFFYPLDFTFVCPTELIAFDHRLDEFESRGVKVFGCSVDSAFTHHAWRNTEIGQGGIGPVGYPLIADLTHTACRAYGVELVDGSKAYRASFLIDRQRIVRHQVVNDLPLGRNIDEMLRMVDALQFADQHGEVCPAGWQRGQASLRESADSVASYLNEHSQAL